MTIERTTFGILSYNQQDFIEDALRGAVSQTYPALDIVLLDDCSIDGTWARAQSFAASYVGPHTLRLYQNSGNLGLLGNLRRLFDLTKTNFLVAAAGDDISSPDRVSAIMQIVATDRTVSMVASNYRCMDGMGVLGPDGRAWIGEGEINTQSLSKIHSPLVVGCTCAYSRDVVGKFPRFGPDLQVEDGVLPFRAALLGRVHYIEKALVNYRIHDRNYSKIMRSSEDSRSGLVNAKAHYQSARQRVEDVRHLLRQDIVDTERSLVALELSLEMERRLGQLCRIEEGGIRGVSALARSWGKGDIGARAALKTAIRVNFPRLWIEYVKKRRRRIDQK